MQYSADVPLVRSVTVDGRDDEYRAIFAEHRTGLYRFAVLLVGDPHVADEVTAEVFAQVLDQAWTASHPVLQTVGGDAEACGPDGCAV